MIPLSGARVGLVVGDVVGRGVDAAATMGRLRTSVRALAALDLPPDELLTRLNDLVSQARVGIHRTPGDEATDRALGATCLYAVYDPTSHTCAVASAGHLPPVATGRGAGARRTKRSICLQAPLGVGGLPFESEEFEFAEGTVLALFTDRMVEARTRDVDEGVADLCGALDAWTGSLQQACGEIVSLRVQGAADDDAALLLVRVRACPEDSMAFWPVASDPAEVAGARALVRGKLEEWGLEEAAFVAELVVSELVTNAIRYGRPPVSLRLLRGETGQWVQMTAELTGGRPRRRWTSVEVRFDTSRAAAVDVPLDRTAAVDALVDAYPMGRGGRLVHRPEKPSHQGSKMRHGCPENPRTSLPPRTTGRSHPA
ncbi:SpoIIE family protein phosphatase [Streptomyces sp. ISL-36]|nr:SpoIIE family protein phosphatase [Streptomyces sp. ISL-36]